MDDTMCRFKMAENGMFFERFDRGIRCEVVRSPFVNFKLEGVMIDNIHHLPVRMKLSREDLDLMNIERFVFEPNLFQEFLMTSNQRIKSEFEFQPSTSDNRPYLPSMKKKKRHQT
ncbi:unnamed protein product [Caenorhabditis angaria]|uniref:Uncharacterized protein n=1 Tax=Caenorhabditis angaria TaxID=860376 RepID=A0A9P1MU19_9PELO|nr:unnamed protein product [Caenorhabditis angaria]